MTALVWDQVGERRYETGIDHGVLFLPDGSAVPWNGLTSVSETTSREIKSYYIDGIKYLDRHIPGSFEAKLKAFTYPDELDELLGMEEFAQGMYVHDQRAKMFNLSYRTHVGNDAEGIDHGYKIHILYNILATSGDASFNTLGAQVTPQEFEWSLRGTPPIMWGVRPTSHISLHSRTIDPDLLITVQEMLYGTFEEDPSLPSMIDLLGVVESMVTP